MTSNSQAWIKETVDRTVKSFVQGFLGSWLVSGRSFDTLLTIDNVKAGALMLALSLAIAVGLKPVGSDNSTSRIV